MRKVLDTYWISGGKGTIGVVLTEDEFKQIGYIGICDGVNQIADEQYVMNWGNKMTRGQAIGFFGNLVNEETYNR